MKMGSTTEAEGGALLGKRLATCHVIEAHGCESDHQVEGMLGV